MFFVQIIDLNGFVHKKLSIPILEEASGDNPCSSFLSQGMIYEFMMSKTWEDQVRFKSKLPLFNTVPCVTDCWTVDKTWWNLQVTRVVLSIFSLLYIATGAIYAAEHDVNPQFPDFFTAPWHPLAICFLGHPKTGQEKAGPSDRGQPTRAHATAAQNLLETTSKPTRDILKPLKKNTSRWFWERNSFSNGPHTSVLPQSDLKDLCTPQWMLSRCSADVIRTYVQLMLSCSLTQTQDSIKNSNPP